MLDRFKVALAIVDAGGLIIFFVTLATGSVNPAILIYLLVFNILVILTDTLRKGLIVHKPGEPVPDLSDDVPINPVTGNMLSRSMSGTTNIFGNIGQEARSKPEVQIKESVTAAAPIRSQESMQPKRVLNIPSGPKDKDREEMEQVLKEWVS